MIKLIHRLLMGDKPMTCKIYPPGVPVPDDVLKRKGRLVVVIDLK